MSRALAAQQTAGCRCKMRARPVPSRSFTPVLAFFGNHRVRGCEARVTSSKPRPTAAGISGTAQQGTALHDLLTYSVKGLGALAYHARMLAAIEDQEVNAFVDSASAKFTARGQVDELRFVETMAQCRVLHARLLSKVVAAGVDLPLHAVEHQPAFGSMPHPLLWNTQYASLPTFSGMLDLAMLDVAKRSGLPARQGGRQVA